SIEARPLRSQSPVVTGKPNLARYMIRRYDWPLHPSTIVMRRNTWERVGEFNPAYQLTDTDWFARAALCCNAVYLPRHGVYNRRHSGNWSNRLGSARMQAEMFEIVEGAIGREFHQKPLQRVAWKALWRANVRLRLAMTLA